MPGQEEDKCGLSSPRGLGGNPPGLSGLGRNSHFLPMLGRRGKKELSEEIVYAFDP